MLAVFAILASLALLVPFPLTDKANPSDTNFILACMIHDGFVAKSLSARDKREERDSRDV